MASKLLDPSFVWQSLSHVTIMLKMILPPTDQIMPLAYAQKILPFAKRLKSVSFGGSDYLFPSEIHSGIESCLQKLHHHAPLEILDLSSCSRPQLSENASSSSLSLNPSKLNLTSLKHIVSYPFPKYLPWSVQLAQASPHLESFVVGFGPSRTLSADGHDIWKFPIDFPESLQRKSWFSLPDFWWLGGYELNYFSPLHAACCNSSEWDIDKIISHFGHENINLRPPYPPHASLTPLHIAVGCGNCAAVVHLVIRYSADPNITWRPEKLNFSLDAIELAAAVHEHESLLFLCQHFEHLISPAKLYRLFYCCNNARIAKLREVHRAGEKYRTAHLSDAKREKTFQTLLDIADRLKIKLEDIKCPSTGKNLLYTALNTTAFDFFTSHGFNVLDSNLPNMSLLSNLVDFYVSTIDLMHLWQDWALLERLFNAAYPRPKSNTLDMKALVKLISIRHYNIFVNKFNDLILYVAANASSEDIAPEIDFLSSIFYHVSDPSVIATVVARGGKPTQQYCWAISSNWPTLLRKPNSADRWDELARQVSAALDAEFDGPHLRRQVAREFIHTDTLLLLFNALKNPLSDELRRPLLMELARKVLRNAVRLQHAKALRFTLIRLPLRNCGLSDELEQLRQDIIASEAQVTGIAADWEADVKHFFDLVRSESVNDLVTTFHCLTFV